MISTKNSLKWLVLLPVGIIVLYLVVCFAIYRIPASTEPEFFKGSVLKTMDFATGTNRQFFEERVLGNRLVRLDNDGIWYVSERDYRILRPSNLEALHDRGITITTELKAQKLLFGGYSIAEIQELYKIKQAPEQLDQ